MSSLFQKYLNQESRRKFLNYLRLTPYYAQPELKIKGIPTKRWKMLLTMRDLRLWIEENAPFSSRSHKLKSEIYQINSELNYLQFRAMIGPFAAVLLFNIWFLYWAPKHYTGHVGINSRPVHLGQTGGMSVLTEGTIPKLTTMDMTEMMGV